MTTQTDEQQTKDFLKRADIRTMKKDLRALREGDALAERDKIAKLKTLEEQLPEAPVKQESQDVQQVLQKSQTEEREAEQSLKKYATEQERQQIFLLESQRLGFKDQIDAIEKQKTPNLKLEKNELAIQKRKLQEKLTPLAEKENQLEAEQQTIAQKANQTTIADQRKSLEQRRWDIEKQVKEVEKQRWALEKQVQEIEKKIKETDQFSQQLVEEKNSLQNKITGTDKSLRDIFSGVIARVEQQKKGGSAEQQIKNQAIREQRIKEKQAVQREQWLGMPIPKRKEFLRQAPQNFQEKLAESAKKEEEQRKQFLQNIEERTQK